MKLYRTKIPVIAKETIGTFVRDGDIEVELSNIDEAEKDLVSVMDEFIRRDNELRVRVKDQMARHNIPYDQYGRTRSQVAEEMNHPQGGDVERFLARQFAEIMMLTRFVEEVFVEDNDLYKKALVILSSHNVDEESIREEARGQVKNVVEGTVDYEVALQRAVLEVKRRRGLIAPRNR